MSARKTISALVTVAYSILACKSDVISQHHVSDRIVGAIYGAIVADALCLGTHYEYDAVKIRAAYGGTTISKFMSPGTLDIHLTYVHVLCTCVYISILIDCRTVSTL
jgi:hypothetical protein